MKRLLYTTLISLVAMAQPDNTKQLELEFLKTRALLAEQSKAEQALRSRLEDAVIATKGTMEVLTRLRTDWIKLCTSSGKKFVETSDSAGCK